MQIKKLNLSIKSFLLITDDERLPLERALIKTFREYYIKQELSWPQSMKKTYDETPFSHVIIGHVINADRVTKNEHREKHKAYLARRSPVR